MILLMISCPLNLFVCATVFLSYYKSKETLKCKHMQINYVDVV